MYSITRNLPWYVDILLAALLQTPLPSSLPVSPSHLPVYLALNGLYRSPDNPTNATCQALRALFPSAATTIRISRGPQTVCMISWSPFTLIAWRHLPRPMCSLQCHCPILPISVRAVFCKVACILFLPRIIHPSAPFPPFPAAPVPTMLRSSRPTGVILYHASSQVDWLCSVQEPIYNGALNTTPQHVTET